MKNYKLLLPLMFFLSSCFVFKTTPKTAEFEKRYSSAETTQVNGDNAPLDIDMHTDVLASAVDADKTKTAFDFQGEGQKALIAAYAGMTKSPEALRKALGTKYLAAAKDDAPIEYTSKNLVATISISPKEVNGMKLTPADRLDDVKIEFELDSNQHGVYFKSWDRFKTQYGRFILEVGPSPATKRLMSILLLLWPTQWHFQQVISTANLNTLYKTQ